MFWAVGIASPTIKASEVSAIPMVAYTRYLFIQTIKQINHSFVNNVMQKKQSKESNPKKPSNARKMNATTVIDIYQRLDDEILGQGGMATVYLGGYAPDAGDKNMLFAIKQMQIKQKIEQSGLDQINLLRKLNHPNIVRFIDARKQQNSMFLILQYCNEGTLEKYIQKNRAQISEEHILKLFAQIALAMRYLQRFKIIHRDIKPKNILLHEGVVKIADFGVAKMMDNHKQNITFEGTLEYMSPQMLKQENYGALTDMWSLGVTLFYMVLGKLPWKQNNGSKLLNEIMKRGNQGTIVGKEPMSQQMKKLIESMLRIKEQDRLSWDELFNHPLLKEYILEYQKEQSKLQESNIQTDEITLEQFWYMNAPKTQKIERRQQQISQLFRESKLKVDQGIETFRKINIYKDKCQFLRAILRDLKEYRKEQMIESKKQLFLKCHYLLAKRSFILSQDLNHIIFLKSNSEGIISIPKKDFDEFMELPKYSIKLNDLRNSAEDLRKYNLNQWQNIQKKFMKVYRSELKFGKNEDSTHFVNEDMFETPNLVYAFNQCFLELFIYLSKPIVEKYANSLYQDIEKSKFLAEFHVDIMFVYDLIVLLCFHNLGENPNFEVYYERRDSAEIQEIVFRIITAYKRWEKLRDPESSEVKS